MSDTKATEAVERGIFDRVLWSHERSMSRLIIVLALAVLLLAGWAITETVLRHMEHQRWLEFMAGYDFESYDYTQDGQGVNIIGNGNIGNEAIYYEPAIARAKDDP